ncbi:unnamed protein product [Didymodactylos carnosus]|uniref:Uncharacterized protein n=1 Tax=Didymodactylos carnosus TaxID=1234261 RepID=A0A813SNP5_9BILA|nr:unnamed protein product [Didymodactylos carnosus]CAF0798952.1 unnamed protein product [Didymodactylos carnosus]CAF3496422.1 unnamed protein product [Didymodactylos carnosus]CAF3583825.1 unnamed protein product [Didymodactylos carnosus]
MIEPQSQSVRGVLSITPRKKSVRFAITSPRLPYHLTTKTHLHPQQLAIENGHNTKDEDKDHLLIPKTNASYSLPLRNNTTNIDHITSDTHFQNLLSDKQIEYVPTTRGLQIRGEKKPFTITTVTNGIGQSKNVILDDLNKFMKTKVDDLRRNMVTVTSTFNEASKQLNSLKKERQIVVKKSRIPISNARQHQRLPSPIKDVNKIPKSINDLREQVLARKFSHLWQKKIFGTLLKPMKQYYNEYLMRKYFNIWKDEWWETRKEWRLMIRAEYHYNLHLLTLFYRTWKQNTSIESIDAEKYLRAKHFADQRLVQHCLRLWINYTSERRVKNQQNQIALQCINRRRTLYFYNLWHTQTSRKLKDSQQYLFANRHYRQQLQRVCFHAWLTYADYRKRKNTHKNRVYKYYQHHLVEKYYSNWRQCYVRHLTVNQNQQRLNELQRKILLRWALNNWKTHLLGLAEEKETLKMAEQYYQRRLVHESFKQLRYYVEKRRMKSRLNWLAMKQRARSLERVYYNEWKYRLERREDLLRLGDFRKAEAFYSMKITIRYWFLWRRYITYCKKEQSRMKAAINYHNSKLIRRYFIILRSNINAERYEQLLETKAINHYRNRRLKLYYNHWSQTTQTHQWFRLNWRLAIIHQEKTMRSNYFRTWLYRAQVKLIENQHEVVAERYYFKYLIRSAWVKWRAIIEEVHNEQRLERIAIQFYYHTIERQVLDSWKLYIIHCRYMKQKYVQANQFYLEHKGREIYDYWKQITFIRKQRMLIVNEKFQRCQRENIRYIFRLWKMNVDDEHFEREQINLAIDHYNRLLKRKILLAWNREIINQIVKDTDNETKLHEYLYQQNLRRMYQVYTHWKQLRDEHLRERLFSNRAQTHNVKKILARYFQQWKEQHNSDMRLKLLERQALWFDRMRLTGRYYYQWKYLYNNERLMEQKKQNALLFWSIQLQKRFFVQWLLYVNERKRKKDRYVQATRIRYEELIRDSLRKFLIYTDHTRQRRQANFIHKQVFLYHDRNALAWKYYSKWKNYVKDAVKRKHITYSLNISHINKHHTTTTAKTALALVRFDNSPPKIVNRPRPRKPPFLSESFHTVETITTATTTAHSPIKIISKNQDNFQSPLRQVLSSSTNINDQQHVSLPHSVHSPFVTFKQPKSSENNNTITSARLLDFDPHQRHSSLSDVLLLPPSAFELNHLHNDDEPISSRPTAPTRKTLQQQQLHRPYSVQPTTNSKYEFTSYTHRKKTPDITTSFKTNEKKNLLQIKERLELYLQNKEKLKRLKVQLANVQSASDQNNTHNLEQEVRQLSSLVAYEKSQLSNVLQNVDNHMTSNQHI